MSDLKDRMLKLRESLETVATADHVMVERDLMLDALDAALGIDLNCPEARSAIPDLTEDDRDVMLNPLEPLTDSEEAGVRAVELIGTLRRMLAVVRMPESQQIQTLADAVTRWTEEWRVTEEARAALEFRISNARQFLRDDLLSAAEAMLDMGEGELSASLGAGVDAMVPGQGGAAPGEGNTNGGDGLIIIETRRCVSGYVGADGRCNDCGQAHTEPSLPPTPKSYWR